MRSLCLEYSAKLTRMHIPLPEFLLISLGCSRAPKEGSTNPTVCKNKRDMRGPLPTSDKTRLERAVRKRQYLKCLSKDLKGNVTTWARYLVKIRCLVENALEIWNTPHINTRFLITNWFLIQRLSNIRAHLNWRSWILLISCRLGYLWALTLNKFGRRKTPSECLFIDTRLELRRSCQTPRAFRSTPCQHLYKSPSITTSHHMDA